MVDLTKILDGCPKGTKLYSPIYGECEFLELVERYNNDCIIKIRSLQTENCYFFSKEGKLNENEPNGECLLFPSKDNKDWSTFTVPKVEEEKHKFQPFEKVLVRNCDHDKWQCDFYSGDNEDGDEFNCIGGLWEECIPFEGNEQLYGKTRCKK